MSFSNLNTINNFNKKYGVEIVSGVAYIELILPSMGKLKLQTFDFTGDRKECMEYAFNKNAKHIIG